MRHKDRVRIRERPASSHATVLPYAAFLDALAKRVGQPSPPRTPALVAPIVSAPPARPTAPPHSSAIAGLGTGIAAQQVIALYQKRGTWRKVAASLKMPLADLRVWASANKIELAILGSTVITELLRHQPIHRIPHVSHTTVRERPLAVQSIAPSPSSQPKSTHWSGLNLSRETLETLAAHSQKVGKAEPECFQDIFDASVLQNTADSIGIGSGVLEELVKAAGGVLVNNTVFEVLRVRRGSCTLAEYLEEGYDADRIDTIARDLGVSTHLYMQFIHCLCPHLLEGVAT